MSQNGNSEAEGIEIREDPGGMYVDFSGEMREKVIEAAGGRENVEKWVNQKLGEKIGSGETS